MKAVALDLMFGVESFRLVRHFFNEGSHTALLLTGSNRVLTSMKY
jgi:hypothetical protein